MEERATMCFNHPDRPAETRCRQCQKPVCEECAKTDIDGKFCSFACLEKYKDYRSRKAPATSRKRSGLFSWLITLIILAAIACGAVYVGGKYFNIAPCQKILKQIGL